MKFNINYLLHHISVIRLLLAVPSTKHVELIKIEWNRKDLHRDVRIAILQVTIISLVKISLQLNAIDQKGAFGLLNSANARYSDAAWQIIELASNSTNPEVLLALLGVGTLTVYS